MSFGDPGELKQEKALAFRMLVQALADLGASLLVPASGSLRAEASHYFAIVHRSRLYERRNAGTGIRPTRSGSATIKAPWAHFVSDKSRRQLSPLRNHCLDESLIKIKITVQR
jgi:hypothetical protein